MTGERFLGLIAIALGIFVAGTAKQAQVRRIWTEQSWACYG